MRQRFQLFLICFVALMGMAVHSASVSAQLTEEQATQIAQERFEAEVPPDYRAEYRYQAVKSGGTDNHLLFVSWVRYINNLAVERYSVIIDINTGEVVRETGGFGYPTEEIDSIPTLTRDQAVFTALQALKDQGATLSTTAKWDPFLRIDGKRPVWVMILKFPRGTVEVVMDADTGQIVGWSPSTGGGSEIRQVPTEFNPTSYYVHTYGMYFLLGALILVGGATFLLRNRIPILKK